ncbi:MAG: hypothetical protein REI12_03160 [Pedobacter sp.]|nr:hypothetical protein [Pedobacter sp.]
MKEKPAPEALRQALPSSIGFNIYFHPTLSVYAIDTFRPSKPPTYPLTTPIPSIDIPLELGSHLSEIAEAYAEAKRQQVANGLPRSYINIAESLSKSLNQPVLAVFSDDDVCDFACIAEKGVIKSLWARCGEVEYRFENETLQSNRAAEDTHIHQNAAEAIKIFTGGSPELIGFGLLDPPDNFGLERLNT